MGALKDISELVSTARDADDASLIGYVKRILSVNTEDARVLSKVAKRSVVSARVFLEAGIEQDDICMPVMAMLCKLYSGYTLVAINVYQSILRFNEISDTMGRIATEGFNLDANNINDVECLEQAMQSVFGRKDGVSETAFISSGPQSQPTANIRSEYIGGGASSEKSYNELEKFALGQYYEVDFKVISGKGFDTVKTALYIQMLPVLMSTHIAKEVVTGGYPETLFRRLMKTYIGEIRPFRDLVLSCDLVKRHGKALKQDANNVLSDFMSAQLSKKYGYVYDLCTGRRRNNLANGIIVIDDATFKEVCHESSVDLTKYGERQRFMTESYVIMLCTIDTIHDVITIYINCVKEPIQLTSRMIKSMSAKKNGISMDDMMKALASGTTPKF